MSSCPSKPTEHTLPPSPPALPVSSEATDPAKINVEPSSAEFPKPTPSAIATLVAAAPISPVATPELLEDIMSPANAPESVQEDNEAAQNNDMAQDKYLTVQDNNKTVQEDGLSTEDESAKELEPVKEV
ncbi:hypothetical protein BG000_009338, partial [Podila horticola]